jgi:hypothetical protein
MSGDGVPCGWSSGKDLCIAGAITSTHEVYAGSECPEMDDESQRAVLGAKCRKATCGATCFAIPGRFAQFCFVVHPTASLKTLPPLARMLVARRTW